MSWVLRMALKEWVDKSILFGDSMIALCWLTSEKLKLSLFHRNRVLQVRRGTDLEDVFHVRTESNPADCGTRPEKVSLSDIGPNSRWENGDPWMNGDISSAVEAGILKPATSLRVTKDIEDEYKRGFVFGDKDEVLFGGDYFAGITDRTKDGRLSKLKERADFSNYLILPTKYSFSKSVRIYAYVLRFIKNARKGKAMTGDLLKSSQIKFSVFTLHKLFPQRFVFSVSPSQGNVQSPA